MNYLETLAKAIIITGLVAGCAPGRKSEDMTRRVTPQKNAATENSGNSSVPYTAEEEGEITSNLPETPAPTPPVKFKATATPTTIPTPTSTPATPGEEDLVGLLLSQCSPGVARSKVSRTVNPGNRFLWQVDDQTVEVKHSQPRTNQEVLARVLWKPGPSYGGSFYRIDSDTGESTLIFGRQYVMPGRAPNKSITIFVSSGQSVEAYMDCL